MTDIAVDAADKMADLDSVLAEDGGGISAAMNAAVGGLAGLANGLQEIVGTEAGVDDDVTSSAVEDMAASGVDGLELDAFMEVLTNVLVNILKLLPFF